MNYEVKLDKELIKFVNKFFKININKLKFAMEKTVFV